MQDKQNNFDPDLSSPRRKIINTSPSPKRTSNPAAVHCSSAPSSAPSSPPPSPQNVTKSLPPSPPPSPSNSREARALIYKTTADDSGSDYASESDVEPDVEPLPPKKFTKHDPFEFLLNSEPSPLLSSPHVLKTVKNSTPIWRTFLSSLKSGNAFHTSLTLLPETGKFMRLYGSVNEYTLGVIFELPTTEYESETFSDTKLLTSYCWASGYSAKTEFNLTSRGDLFNGRGDNLVSISELIKQNEAFSSSIPSSVPIKLHGRDTSTPMSSVPFNEIYIRISGTPPYNLLNGLGTPIGIFSRSSCYCDLVELLKKREVFEEEGLRLFFISHEDGVRELGGRGEVELLKTLANDVEPFLTLTSSPLIFNELTSENLTLIEHARLAGGYGVRDEDVKELFRTLEEEKAGRVLGEGIDMAVRASNPKSAEQLLTCYYESGFTVPIDTTYLLPHCNGKPILTILSTFEILSNFNTNACQSKMRDCSKSLEEWCLEGARKGVAFRLRSWRKLRKGKKEEGRGNSRMAPFLSHEAIEKRHLFALSLRFASSPSSSIRSNIKQLHAIALKMNKPCLRLEILQYILGLGKRCGLKVIQNSLELAVKVLVKN